MSKEEYLKDLAKELHKPVRRNFIRRKVSFQYLDQVWAADLVDMSEWAHWNKGYKWMLNCVDGFSRYAFSEPMKDKTAQSTFDAFERIIESSGRKPDYIWCDQGKEFINSLFANDGYSKDKGTMYFVHNEGKACIVERFNRTLKTMSWKRAYELNTKDWHKMLPFLIDEYNHKIHSTLKMSPADACKKKNFQKVLLQVNHVILKPPKVDNRIVKFEINEVVRISKIKKTFSKGYEPGWTIEQFKISSIIKPNDLSQPIVYSLEDENGEKIDGSFYAEELQKVKNPGIYLIDKTLKKRKYKGKTQYLVSYIGFDSSNNSWVNEEDFAT
jgi:hypothetical protein